MKLVYILIIMVLFSFVTVNAALTCTTRQNSCQAGETAIFRMSGWTNAHAEVASGTNYNYVVCCGGVTNLGTACTGDSKSAVVLNLSSPTNAHSDWGAGSTYTTGICISADYNVDCQYTTSDCSTLGSDYECVAKLSASQAPYVNSHIGNCSSPYPTNVCCNAVSCQTLGQTCSGTGLGDCCSSQGLYCSHGQDGTLPDGESRCCLDGYYWDGIQCVSSGKCNPTPCPYTNVDPRFWSTPGCFRYTPKPYEQACCPTDIYGTTDYYFVDVITR